MNRKNPLLLPIYTSCFLEVNGIYFDSDSVRREMSVERSQLFSPLSPSFLPLVFILLNGSTAYRSIAEIASKICADCCTIVTMGVSSSYSSSSKFEKYFFPFRPFFVLYCISSVIMLTPVFTTEKL